MAKTRTPCVFCGDPASSSTCRDCSRRLENDMSRRRLRPFLEDLAIAAAFGLVIVAALHLDAVQMDELIRDLVR